MNEFCPKDCLFVGMGVHCHNRYAVKYDTPIPAVINYRNPQKIEIIGENTHVICNAYGHDIGPTWYVRNERGEVSGISLNNPLVTFEGQVYVPPEPRKWVPPEYKKPDRINKGKRKKGRR